MFVPVLSALNGTDDLNIAIFAKFRSLPLGFWDNFPVHGDSDACLRRIQF